MDSANAQEARFPTGSVGLAHGTVRVAEWDRRWPLLFEAEAESHRGRGDFWRDHVASRDRLRRNPALAAEYADLKRALAAKHPSDRAAYTAGKAAFVERVGRDGTPGAYRWFKVGQTAAPLIATS